MKRKQLRGMLRSQVARVLHSDVTKWRVPSILLRAFGGLLLSGLVLALTLPLFTRNGGHVNQPFAWLVMLGCVTLCVAPEVRRLFPRQRIRPRS